MKRILTQACSILTAEFILSQIASGQSDAGFKPASSNIQGAEFPKISADNSVYVRIKAPDAVKVQVQGGDGICPKPLDLVKDTTGNWDAVIPIAGPGFHYYWFIIDGVRVNEEAPGNPHLYQNITYHEKFAIFFNRIPDPPDSGLYLNGECEDHKI